MASGASTRFGFTGGGTDGDGPPDLQSARTMYGRDLHLDRAALESGRVEGPVEGPVEGRVEESMADTTTEPVVRHDASPDEDAREVPSGARPRPSHTGKSRFPALARFLGRWRTNGGFEAAPDDADLDDTLTIPQDRLLRPLAIVVATAAISFTIVVALLKLRDTADDPPIAVRPVPTAPIATAPVPQAAPPPRVVPAAAPPAVAAPRPAPAPAPSPPPARVAAPQPFEDGVVGPDDAQKARVQPAPAKRTPVVQRRARRPRPQLDPDGPMPLSF